MESRIAMKKKMIPTLLLLVALAIITAPTVVKADPEVCSSDSHGNKKVEFDIFDDEGVFVTGSGCPTNTLVTIQIKDDLGNVVASISVTTDGDGSIPVTLAWPSPLYKITTAQGTIWRFRDCEYDILVDGNVFNTFLVIYPHHESGNPDSEAPEFTVPEPGTIALMLAMFGALATAYLTRKRIY